MTGSVNARPRFGLVGTGVWARNVHARAAAESEAVDFTSVFGRRIDAAADLAADHGAAAFTDFTDFLDSVDIVGFALPPAVQPEYAVRAATAGKHLLLEKPIAIDPAEARDVVRAVEDNDVASIVFFTNMFLPPVQEWIREARAAGDWRYARAESFSRVRSDPANPYFGTEWRSDIDPMWDTGPHLVSIFREVLGQIVRVQGARTAEGLTEIVLEHSGGALSTLTLTLEAEGSLPSETALFGAAGKLIFPSSADWDVDARAAYAAALAPLADRFAGRDVSIALDARYALGITEVLSAAERAIESGRSVTM